GGTIREYTLWETVRNLAVFVSLIALVTTIFVCIGTELGWLFSKAGEKSIDAYAADLAGSLAGVLCFAALTLANATPPIWLLLGMAPLVVLRPGPVNLGLGLATVVLGFASIQGALYSPYNRIDVSEHESGFATYVKVNRDFHQIIWDFDDAGYRRSPTLSFVKKVYDLPFLVNPRRESALIVGAGTGNDAEAAVRNGYQRIIAVEIDPIIIALGVELHPQKPYTKGGVRIVLDDARAFFRRYDGPAFDAVVFGLLDSHAMASAMSSIRLDNFVYTREGIRSAWSHVVEDGHLAVGFSVISGFWMAKRIHSMLWEVTGIEPVALYHGLHNGATFIVSRNPAIMDPDKMQALADELDALPMHFEKPGAADRIPTDDWPYLYVRPGVFPWIYLFIVGLVALTALVSIPLAYGINVARNDFDPPMFLIGAAFLLLETRGVTALSLLYGSTWIVNAAVFSGILAMALAATLIVRRFGSFAPTPWFLALILSTLALWQFDLGVLNELPFALRGVIGSLIHAVPVFFAGLLFPLLLSRSRNPAASLGSNLIGAVLGGCLEYSSMLIGLKALVAMAAVFYLFAFLSFRSEQHDQAI
ncbi:MAG: hypothetical protein O7G83_01770, partial [Proteobacteria bacterium]|nr:hypothetical protein [Pseudomonadota bacterium]